MITPESIWLSLEEVCELTDSKKETIRRKCKSGELKSRFNISGKYKNYEILLSSLSEDIIQKYENYLKPTIISEQSIEEFSNAPKWMREKAEKYLELFELTKDMSYAEKVAFLKEWSINHPDKKTCYSSLAIALRKYNEGGIAALMSKHGNHRVGLSKLNEEYFDYFKSIYLREGAPSAETAWHMTLGYAKKNGFTEMDEFPTSKTFLRHLKQDVPEQAVYLARYGNAAWNKKYASYIPRNYENIKAGSCWVSDHAQIDIAVNFKGTVCFPWVTVFRDVKTSKWLGWFLHAESPNSDHIFQ